MTYRSRLLPLRFAALLVGLVLLSAGCGLSDYARQMSDEADLAHQWEEENKLLGDPLSMPTFPKKDGKDQPSWVVFLRPPVGVNSTPVAQPTNAKLTQFKGPLAQYTAKGASFGLQHVYLGVGGGDPKEFYASVYGQFGASAGGESVVPIPRSPVLLSGTDPSDPDVKREITVERKLVELAQSQCSFNFYKHNKAVVAVVYEMNKGAAGKEKEAAARAEPAIRASLSTLGEGRDEVPALRNAYLSRNQGK